MTYYIDFDNTLFDTNKFYNDLLNLIRKYNINENDINMYYISNHKNELFSPIKIINEIIKNNPLKTEIKKEIDYFIKDISKYLYNDTVVFLKYLNNQNYQVNLLSYGDYEYQNMKINNSLIKDYFDKIIITSKMKYELNLDYENSFFVDDDVVQIAGLLKKKASVIRIRRKGNKHSEFDINDVFEYNSFIEYINSAIVDKESNE